MSDFDGSYDDGCCEDDTGASAEAASYNDQVSSVLADVDGPLDDATDVVAPDPTTDTAGDTGVWVAAMDEPTADPTPDPATDTGVWVVAMDDPAASTPQPTIPDDSTAGWLAAMDDPAATSPQPTIPDDTTIGWLGGMDAADASGPSRDFSPDPIGWLAGETGTLLVPADGITKNPLTGTDAVDIVAATDAAATTLAPAGFTMTADGSEYVDGAGRTSEQPPPGAAD